MNIKMTEFMNKCFLSWMSLALLPLTVNAQIYQDVSNSTATVVRDPARQASTEIDAVLFNPAGTALLDDGWHFSLSEKLAYKSLHISHSNRDAEHRMYDIIPSLQVAYKKKNLALSFSYANEGGYGMYFPSEIPSLSNSLTNANANGRVEVDGDLYNHSFRLGAAYQLNRHWSVSLGFRYNIVTEKTTIAIKKVNSIFAANLDYTCLIDERTNGWGIAPIFGIDYQINRLNFAAKYEFETKINTNPDSLSYHIPSLLTLGASWQLKDNLRVSVGGSWHHQKCNSIYSREQKIRLSDPDSGLKNTYYYSNNKLDDLNSWNVSASISFSPMNHLQFSIGYTYAMQSQLSKEGFSQSCASGDLVSNIVSGGLRYDINDKVQLDFGISSKSADFGGSVFSYINKVDRFGGTNMSAGININL